MTEQMTTDQLIGDFEKMKPLITDEVLDQIEDDIGSNQPWGQWIPLLKDPSDDSKLPFLLLDLPNGCQTEIPRITNPSVPERAIPYQ